MLDRLLFYQQNEMVDYVQPDYIYATATVDPLYAAGYQWGLAKISAPAAWSNPSTGTTGSDSVVVAIADTGAGIDHPDFQTNLWSGQNNDEVKNFIDNSTNVFDGALPPHGSNVASIVGAQGDNGIFMRGVSWNVSLMHLKVLNDGEGKGTSQSIANGISYATNHGASAINLSVSFYKCVYHYEDGKKICDETIVDPTTYQALVQARDRKPDGVVAVCAAGNGFPPDGTGLGVDTDALPHSPSNTPTDNVISVAASDQNDARAPFSNYGARTVDLAAPGMRYDDQGRIAGIYGLRATYNNNSSDFSTNNYSILPGTSQAAPYVTGTIALLKAKYPWESYHGLRDRILMSTDKLTDPSWTGRLRTGGRLNADKALHARTLIRNLSTRARVESGDRVMIGGFIIGGSGTGTLKLAIRGLGPSLSGLTAQKLSDPKIRLTTSDGAAIYSNDDWGTLPLAQRNELIASGLAPSDSREAAMIWTLGPGSYTVTLERANGSFGVGLFELYELEGGLNQKTRLQNVSTRCLVGTGEEQAIAGVIVGDPDPAQGGDPTIPKRSVLMFGKGPSLPLAGKLADPFLSRYNAGGTLVATNDSWRDVAAPVDELDEAQLGPTSLLESALWPILNSGTHTVRLRGANGGSGVGLVELYEY